MKDGIVTTTNKAYPWSYMSRGRICHWHLS